MAESIVDSQSVDHMEYPYAPQPPMLPFQAVEHTGCHSGTPRSQRRLIPAIALVAIFGLNNLAIVPLMDVVNGPSDSGAVLVFMLIGVIVAQAALISIGFVFAEGLFWRRLVLSLSTTIVFWGIWEIGFISSQLFHGRNPGEYADEIQFTLLVLPLAAIAVQWPLWFFRLYLGWLLIAPTENEAPAQPLSIRDYLIGTAIAGLAVTLARLAPSETWDMKDYWGGWAAFFGFAGAISVAFVVPVMVVMLRLPDWRVGCFLVGFYSIVAGVIFLGVVAVFDKNFRDNVLTRNGFLEALSILVAFATFGVFLAVGLIAAREIGIGLVFGAKARSGLYVPQTHVIDAPRAGSHAKE